jgi:hypothetical protein
MRRSYPAQIVVNGRLFRRVVIDRHYEKKHRDSVDDTIVLGLVQALDGKDFEPETVGPTGFQYFMLDPWYFAGKPYRLIWLLPPGDEDFIGIVNTFRRRDGRAKG